MILSSDVSNMVLNLDLSFLIITNFDNIYSNCIHNLDLQVVLTLVESFYYILF